jgi:hypothetical protein
MNSSLITCDRATHLKIVAVALVAGIAVFAVGIHARSNDVTSSASNAKPATMVAKAGKPAVYATRDDSTVR